MTAPALAPLDEYAPLLDQVRTLFDERDALAVRLRELEVLMRCHLCPSPPVYHEAGRWTCAACWLRTNP